MTRIFILALLLATALPAYAQDAKEAPKAPAVEKTVSKPVRAANPDAKDRIIAKVNGDIITSGDVWERYFMVQKSTRLPDNVTIRKDAFPQILDSLINEKLQRQEAKRVGITASDDDIAKALNELATRNKQKPEEFQASIEKSGINIAEMRRQIEAQLLWIGVVRRVVRPTVNVTEAEVTKLADELNAVKGKKEYKFAEIRLPGTNPQQKKDSVKLANSLTGEMRKGAPFHVVAEKFSIAESAKDGGLRTSVFAGEMPAPIDKVLSEMPEGALSNPLEAEGQIWMVLKLGERVNKGAPEDSVIRERIGTVKLERAATAYLLDLRDEALIEYPG